MEEMCLWAGLHAWPTGSCPHAGKLGVHVVTTVISLFCPSSCIYTDGRAVIEEMYTYGPGPELEFVTLDMLTALFIQCRYCTSDFLF